MAMWSDGWQTHSTRRRGSRFRPRVEALEGRIVPADFHPRASTPDSIVDLTSLRTSVFLANLNGQHDTIFLQAGVYPLTLTNTAGQENAGRSGDLDLTEWGHTITFQGAGAGVTIIDGGALDRVFQVFENVTVVFRDLTIRNGLARDVGTTGVQPGVTSSFGGGILNRGGHVTLENAVVEGNVARGGDGSDGSGSGQPGGPGRYGEGGGIYSYGPLAVTGSTVRNNQALGGHGGAGSLGAVGGRGGDGGQGLGGGVFVQGLAVFTRSTISHNAAHGGAGGRGGAGAGGGVTPSLGGDGGQGVWGGGGGVFAQEDANATFTNTTVSTNTTRGGD